MQIKVYLLQRKHHRGVDISLLMHDYVCIQHINTSFLIFLPVRKQRILESPCLKICSDLKEQKIYVVQMHSTLIDSSTGCNILLEHKKGTVADLGNGMQRPHFSSLFNRIVSRKPM